MTSFMSGMVNDSDNVYLGGYPGPLKDVTGVWVEESDAVVPGHRTTVNINGHEYDAHLVCDQIHLTGAKAVATYANEFYAGTPAVTENRYGRGMAWYVGSRLDHDGLWQIVDQVIKASGVTPLVDEATELEITERTTTDGRRLYFVLNMSNDSRPLPMKFRGYRDLLTDRVAKPRLAGWDVEILTQQ